MQKKLLFKYISEQLKVVDSIDFGNFSPKHLSPAGQHLNSAKLPVDSVPPGVPLEPTSSGV